MMVKSKTIEKLSEDLLDSDFTRIFKPILFLQHLQGICAVHMESKFVTLSTKLYKAYYFLTWTVKIIALLCCLLYSETKFDSFSSSVPFKTGIAVSGLINGIQATKNVLFDGRANCEMFVALQKIDRNLKLKNAKINEGLFKVSIAVAIAGIIFLSLWIYVFLTRVVTEITPYAFLSSIACAIGYVHYLMLFTIVYFIRARAQYINNTLRNNIEKNKDKSIDELNGIVPDEIVKGMYCVLDTFAKVLDLFQFGLLCITFQLLGWQLTIMHYYVMSIKYEVSVYYNTAFLYALPSCSSNLANFLLICIVIQSLINKLEETRNICKNLKSTLKKGKSRDNAKSLILLVNGKRDATIYGFFTINSKLPLNLLAITASYTIVLLQFAVL